MLIAKQNFWNDADQATRLLKERTSLSGLIETCHTIFTEIEEVDILMEMAREEEDKDGEKEASTPAGRTGKKGPGNFPLISPWTARTMPGTPLYPSMPVPAAQIPRTGRRCSFACIPRWIDKRGYKYKVIDYQPGDEARHQRGHPPRFRGELLRFYEGGIRRPPSGPHLPL